jgi:hypothetical protein
MKKICTGRDIELDAEKDFNWKYKEREIRHSRCRSCLSRVSKQHSKDNKQSYIARNLIRGPLVLRVSCAILSRSFEKKCSTPAQSTIMAALAEFLGLAGFGQGKNAGDPGCQFGNRFVVCSVSTSF